MINGGNFVFLAANSSKYKCKLVPSFRACSYLGDTFYGISEIGKATALEHRLNHEQKLLLLSFFFFFFFPNNTSYENSAESAFDNAFSIKLVHEIKLLSFTFSRTILVMT